ncbi:MAG: RNA methyltransferase [Acidimicrobiales bacterium]|nr:RNA methyltransferase [Acidimicrobiales bacterium]
MKTYTVEDPNDPLVADYLRLDDHLLRQERELPDGDMAGFFLAEGNQVIERGISSGYVLSTLLIDTSSKKPLPKGLPQSANILLCNEIVLTAISGRPYLRDPIGSFFRPPLPDAAAALKTAKTVVVTERVNNPTNMGALFRNACALGSDLVCLDPSSCDPMYRRAVRVSMGQVFSIKHVRLPLFPEGLRVLKSAGFALVALTPGNHARRVGDFCIGKDDPVALIIGAEGPGLTEETLQESDYQIRIPMDRNVDSLNVGTAAAVALYAIREARFS